jgi:hypothetical protein
VNVVLYRELYHLARTSYIYHVSSVMKYIEMFLSYQINGNLHKLYNYWYFLFPRTITVLRSGNLKINVKYINLHKKQTFTIGLGLWCLTPLSTICQLYHGRGNWSTQRKPPTSRKSLTNFIT